VNGGYTAAVSETSVWKSSERRNTSLGNDHQLGRRGGGGARLLIGTQKQSVPAAGRARVAVQMRNGFEMRSRQHCAVRSCDRCPYWTGNGMGSATCPALQSAFGRRVGRLVGRRRQTPATSAAGERAIAAAAQCCQFPGRFVNKN